MDGDVLSENEPSEEKQSSHTEIFESACPYYLALGMTPEQYWKGEPSLARWYRESFRIKQEMRNEELWLQGMYFYDALCDASPLLHAFAKKGTKAAPYPKEPYDLGLGNKQTKKQKQVDKDRKLADEAKMRMENLMVVMAQKLNSKGGKTDGEH